MLGLRANVALAEFDFQLLVAQRLGTVDISRAVVAERGRSQRERNLKATLDLLRKEKEGSVQSYKNKSLEDTGRMPHPQYNFLALNLSLVPAYQFSWRGVVDLT